MFKVIGVITVLAVAALGGAVYTGVLDFNANAKVTAKGEQQVRELRNQAAEAIRGVGDRAADATEAGGPAK